MEADISGRCIMGCLWS